MSIKFYTFLLSCLFLSGCIASDNPIPLDTVASFRLKDVKVTFPMNSHLNFTTAENEYAASKGVNDAANIEALANSSEGAAFIRGRAAAKMQEAFREAVGPILHGNHPVRVEVAVKAIDIPGAARSVVLGGTATLLATIILVDDDNGQVISMLPNEAESVGRGGGILGTVVQSALEDSHEVDEPYARLCKKLSHSYAEWLFKKRSSGS